MMRRIKFNAAGSWSLPRLIAISVLVAIASYTLFALSPLLRGPHLVVNLPRKTDHGTVIIEGIATRVSTLSINGLPTPITHEGVFSIERAYPAGYTVVIVSASDRFGRTTEATRTFITHLQESYGTQKENN